MTATIASAAARALLGRRRTLLLVLFAAVPVLVALVARDRGPNATETAAEVIDLLVVRAVLPITALVLGTAALGSELEDGTAIFLLTSPMPRWKIIAAKLIVAGGGTALVAGGSALLAGLVVAVDGPSLSLVAGALVAVIVGSLVYAALFLAASVITNRALILGLIYTLVWEGTLASLFAGTRFLSVRQYVLSIADGLDGTAAHPFGDTLDMISAVVLAAIVLVLALAVAVDRLRSWEIGPAD
ncbi:MAG TPA: ABC transporter permease [Candidatus Limnocylindrales bacterium]